jgi:dTDP-3-amino-3,4,6-trideoxy-alpha-D-glucose transaminase
VRMLRLHGSRDKVTFERVGVNSRLDELQAAVLRLFLGQVDRWNSLRRQAAARYRELGLGEVCALPVDEPGHVYHMYVVRTPERERIAAALRRAGIGHAAYYTTPLHLQPALRYLGYEPGSLPETERAARENLALPLWPGIDARAQEQVVAVVRAAARVGVA